MNPDIAADPVGTVYEALQVLQNKPADRWGLKYPIVAVQQAGRDLPSRKGVNFQVILEDPTATEDNDQKEVGVSLKVIGADGKPCARHERRAHGMTYLIEQVRVFAGDDLPKIIRRVVQCINRALNVLRRKDDSRTHWERTRDREERSRYFRTSRTLIVPKFDPKFRIWRWPGAAQA